MRDNTDHKQFATHHGMLLVPLGLAQNDHSREADTARYNLHAQMMALNPQGWRVPQKHLRTKAGPDRLTELAERLYGA